MPLRSPSALEKSCPMTMPVSSTVWCWSTSRSPLAVSVRSKPPCLVKSSSMWSRKRMPVEILYSPRPSSRSSPVIWVSFVLRVIVAVRATEARVPPLRARVLAPRAAGLEGKGGLQRIDIVENRDGAFFVEEAYEIVVARVGARSDADEGNVCRARGAGVVHRVPDVPAFSMSERGADFVQAFGIGLGARDVIHADDWFETVGQEAVEGDVGFPAQAPGEDREVVALGKAIEEAVRRDPLFLEDEAVRFLALENLLEVIDNFLVGRAAAVLLNEARRELPVVVPAAAVFPVLNFFVGWPDAGEVLDGRLDRRTVGFVDVDEDAIHVEDEKVF